MKSFLLSALFVTLFHSVFGFAECANFSGQWSGGCNRYNKDGSLLLETDQTVQIVQFGCEKIAIGWQTSAIGGKSTEAHRTSQFAEAASRSARWSDAGKLIIASKHQAWSFVGDKFTPYLLEVIENKTYSLAGANLASSGEIEINQWQTERAVATRTKLKEKCSFSKIN